MSRLIDADALLLALDKRKTYELADGRNRAYGKGVRDAMKDVNDQPTVDAITVRHGHWIGKPLAGYSTVKCSVCGSAFVENNGKWKYCPDCGAKMDEVKHG